MKYKATNEEINRIFAQLSEEYNIYAPIKLAGKGRFSDTDLVRYGEINQIEEGCWDEKSDFSPKEVIYPITQTLFYFTEDSVREPEVDEKPILLFLRPCDYHAVRKLDKIFLENGPEPDVYYQRLREKVKFMIIECAEGFDNCLCVDMETNRVDEYDGFFRFAEEISFEIKDEEIDRYFKKSDINNGDFEPQFVEENKETINLFEPDEMDMEVFESPIWKEYSKRCIGCGRCNMACPSCSCFTMQDIRYEDNPKCGERRRVWAGCHIDGFTEMAGGHSFRENYGDRMRFKVLHKVYDFKKRFGEHMCVGCGRCDDICPEYISIRVAVNKVSKLLKEGEANG